MDKALLQDHYLIVEGIEVAMMQPRSYPGLMKMYETHGMSAKWDLSEAILERFQELHANTDWSYRDWIDTLDNFVKDSLLALNKS